jgi:hypothetical protein
MIKIKNHYLAGTGFRTGCASATVKIVVIGVDRLLVKTNASLKTITVQVWELVAINKDSIP